MGKVNWQVIEQAIDLLANPHVHETGKDLIERCFTLNDYDGLAWAIKHIEVPIKVQYIPQENIIIVR